MTMVDRIVVALEEGDGFCDYEDIARAVLTTMREPSANLRWAGSGQLERMKAEGYDAAEAFGIIWAAVIDAALAETQETV